MKDMVFVSSDEIFEILRVTIPTIPSTTTKLTVTLETGQPVVLQATFIAEAQKKKEEKNEERAGGIS